MEQQNIEYIYQMSRRKTEAVKNDFPALIVPKNQLGKPFDWHQGLQGRGKDKLMLQHMKEAFPDRSKALYVSLEGLYDSHPCSLAELIERHEDIAADVLFHQNVVMHSNKYLLFQKFFCKLNFCVFL